ncbi:MAG TPA: dATP/dGTP pyrophosphohydrolase domain-containing protein [Pseudorhodoferax sp.]|nr:dATP/dGTP pyrophosphohydrolase domain-containing protein [Pseudorhodoferax sp.]
MTSDTIKQAVAAIRAGANQWIRDASATVREDGTIEWYGDAEAQAEYQRLMDLASALEAVAAPAPAAHIDDDAVDHFAVAMKEKLAQARAKGRSGWHGCNPADLSRMLREHVEKGDPRDVANFCMFLWSLGHPITAVPKFDFAAYLQRQREFSERTFGPGRRTKGVCDHIRKELLEVESSPEDLIEWIDVVILALDGAWRSDASPAQIIDAIVAKQTKNEGRTWPDWRTMDPNKAIEHTRLGEAAPQPAAQASGQAGPILPEEVPADMVQSLRSAVEGECDGLDMTERRARMVLAFLLTEYPDWERFKQAPAASAEPAANSLRFEEALAELVDKIVPGLDSGDSLADAKIASKALDAIQQPAASAEPVKRWAPEKCPITGRPFFMWIEHHATGEMVPTYGGPYDSYTLAERRGDDYICELFDHDAGGWMVDCVESLGVRVVDDQSLVIEPSNPRYDDIERFAAAPVAAQAPADGDALDALESMCRQCCHTGDGGETDSGAISAYAESLELLAANGRFRIVRECGRMVVGHWPENDPQPTAGSDHD